jgi:hypothetical protein
LELDRLLALAAEAGARLSGNHAAAYMTIDSTEQPERKRTNGEESPGPVLGHVLRAELVDDAALVDCWAYDRLDDVVEGWWRSVKAEAMHHARSSCGTLASLSDFNLGRPTLFVASMVDERANHIVHAFAAFMATDMEEVRTRLVRRVGHRTAATAVIRIGFDPSEPIAASLLSEAMSSLLEDIAQHADSILAEGLDLFVEHRFA